MGGGGLCSGPETTRNACHEARLVLCQHQDEVEAAASRCARGITSTEAAVNETPRQSLSVLRRQSSVEMSRSTLWRALRDDLQARCFKPDRAPRLTAENPLARLNFCLDVLQASCLRVYLLLSLFLLSPSSFTIFVFCLSLLLSPSTFSLPLSSFLLFFSWSLLFFLASLALFFIIIIITHHHQCCFSILLSMTFTFDALFDSNLAVATLAPAISFSNVRKDSLRHELSWLCLVQQSTNLFCVFPSPLKPVPDSPVPTSSTNVGSPDGSVPGLHGIGARSNSTVDEQFYDILPKFAQLDSHLAQPQVLKKWMSEIDAHINNSLCRFSAKLVEMEQLSAPSLPVCTPSKQELLLLHVSLHPKQDLRGIYLDKMVP